MGRDALLRLQDMHESIEAAFRLIESLKRTDLDGDEARYSACMYRILVVAEAAKHLPKTLLARYSDIPWGELIRMGDMLRHQYFRIEADIVSVTPSKVAANFVGAIFNDFTPMIHDDATRYAPHSGCCVDVLMSRALK